MLENMRMKLVKGTISSLSLCGALLVFFLAGCSKKQDSSKVIAKVGGKGILHSRAASRKISSLTRLVNRAS